MILYQWECPDCEAITNGNEPPTRCRCGQGLIIRNLTAEEEPTDNEEMMELSEASNPQEQAATTAKTLTQEEIEEREEATCDWYDENDRKYRLVDEGQTFDGEGESYAERNA